MLNKYSQSENSGTNLTQGYQFMLNKYSQSENSPTLLRDISLCSTNTHNQRPQFQ